MQQNPFDKLLQEFREAYAAYGGVVFYLSAWTHEELDGEWGEDVREWADCLGCARLTGGSTYYIYAPVCRNRRGKWAEAWREPFDRFETLAANAGASLPAEVRQAVCQSVDDQPASPVSWWLTFMWVKNSPPAEDLLPPDGVTRNYRLFSGSPFFDSIELIECHLLNTSMVVPAEKSSVSVASQEPHKPTDETMEAVAAPVVGGSQQETQQDDDKQAILDGIPPLPPNEDDRVRQGGDEDGKPRALKQYEWLAKAMLLVRDHPDSSDAKVAKKVGVNRSTLFRSMEYQRAKKQARQQLAKGHVKIDEETGLRDIEAASDDHGRGCSCSKCRRQRDTE